MIQSLVILSSLLLSSSLALDIFERELKAGPIHEFCNEGYALAWVSFDYRSDCTPILGGEVLEDIGFGFTMSILPGEGAVEGIGPTVYDTDLEGGNDEDLEVKVGNALIIQEQEAEGPDDNAFGGEFIFDFDEPTDVYSIQLVDIETKTRLTFRSNGDRAVFRPEPAGDRSINNIYLGQKDLDKLQVKLFGSGAIGRIMMCVPECIDIEDEA